MSGIMLKITAENQLQIGTTLYPPGSLLPSRSGTDRIMVHSSEDGRALLGFNVLATDFWNGTSNYADQDAVMSFIGDWNTAGGVPGSSGAFSDITGSPNSNTLLKKQINPTRVIYLSQYGCTPVDILAASSAGYTDSTSVIQGLIDTASITNRIDVVVDAGFAITGIKLKSYSTLRGLNPSCGFILMDGSDYTVIENNNLTYTAGARVDKFISVRDLIINGNSGHNVKASTTTGLNCLMRWYGVEDLSWSGITFLKPPGYTVHAVNCLRVQGEKARVDVGTGGAINMDGIHADAGCEDVIYRDLILNTHDDGIAVSADDLWNQGLTAGYYPSNMPAAIKNILAENITLKSELYGGRVMSGAHRVDGVIFRNWKGYTYGYAFILDNFWQSPSLLSDAGPGNIGTVIIEDIDVDILGSGGNNDCVINVNCNVEKLILRGFKRNKPSQNYPTFYITGAATVIRHLIIEGYESYDDTAKVMQHLIIDAATVNILELSGIRVDRTLAANGSRLAKLQNGGTVDVLMCDGVFLNGIDNLIDDEGAGVQLINAAGIIHINPPTGEATFKSDNVIPRIVCSNYTGDTILDGTFTDQIGDAFATGAAGGGVLGSLNAGLTPTNLLFDDFNRADSALTLGNLITPNTPWIIDSGVWGIASNKAYCVSATTTGSFRAELAYADCGHADFKTAFTLNLANSSSSVGVGVRRNSSGYILVQISSGAYGIFTGSGASFVSVNGAVASNALATNIDFVVECTGTSVNIYKNGVYVFGVTTSYNITETEVGLVSESGGGTGGGATWENFRVYQ